MKTYSLKKQPSRDTVVSRLYQCGALTDLSISGTYPYMIHLPDNTQSKLPYNIILPDKTIYPGTAVYEKANDPWGYNVPINDNDRFDLIFHKWFSNFCNTHNLKFFWLMQMHSDEADYTKYSWREPTAEEISVQEYLGLALGAKSIMLYTFHTDDKTNGYWSRGLVDTLNNNYTKRLKNYYKYTLPFSNDTIGLDKWNPLAKLDSTTMKIGNILYPPNQSNNYFSYDGTSTVDFVGSTKGYEIPSKYINNFVTYHHRIHSNLYDSVAEPTYFEIGFFTNPRQQDYKYFIMVNKNCTPEINSDGDSRKVRFKFQRYGSDMQNFANWELKNMITGESQVFNMDDTSGFIYTYPFAPGEGKFFRLAPVMKVGGTFVCNETANGSFVCDSTVFTNGYNLTVNPGSSISFSAKGKIVMNGGNFYSGLNPSSPSIAEFKGNGVQWEGISLSGCTDVQIDNSVFSNIAYADSLQKCALNLQNCFDFYVHNSTFNLSTPSNGINLFFTDDVSYEFHDADIYNCTFTVSDTATPISVVSVASLVTPVEIDNNKFALPPL